MIVCFPGSIHAARWLNVLRGSRWRVVVFPCFPRDPILEMQPFRLVSERSDLEGLGKYEIGWYDNSLVPTVGEVGSFPLAAPITGIDPKFLATPDSLVAAIDRFSPELIHSMELQHNSYLVLAAKLRSDKPFPKWLASNWGSDIFLYKQLRAHRPVLRRLIQQIDALHSECDRDFKWAYRAGFSGFRFPATPASGGLDMQTIPSLHELVPTSQRRTLLIKGYHGWAGRALHILQAIHLVAPQLQGYTIRIAHGTPVVRKMAEAVSRCNNLDLSVDERLPTSREAIARLAHSRAVVGFGISDGISTTVLEAMAVGTFPIQPKTSCAGEWIVNEETGLLVPWFDINGLARSIITAMTDDVLVDQAAAKNRLAIEQRWALQIVRPRVLSGYEQVVSSGR